MIKQQVVTQLSIIISFKYLFYSLFITRNKRILYFTLIRCFVLPYLVYRVSPSHQKKNGYVGKKNYILIHTISIYASLIITTVL